MLFYLFHGIQFHKSIERRWKRHEVAMVEIPMKYPLAIYLHDHLAGASYAVDLLDALRDHYKNKPLGQFAALLYEELTADQDVLHRIAEQIGPASDPLKDGAAWLSEKISRVKLSHSDPSGLGTFEAIEFLALGIHGKLLLWRALADISLRQPQLTGIDFELLAARAQAQEQSVERYRLEAGCTALLGTGTSMAEARHA